MGRRSQVAAAGALLALVAWSSVAGAQAGPGGPPAGPSESKPYGGPNVPVLVTGLLTLALAYAPAVIVSSESTNSADSSLGVPVVGPWVDLTNRYPCGPGAVPCGRETGNIALIVVDGIAQDWGLLAAAASFFISSKSVPATASEIHVMPARVGAGGYGLAAWATF
jgi:hypothetical protein